MSTNDSIPQGPHEKDQQNPRQETPPSPLAHDTLDSAKSSTEKEKTQAGPVETQTQTGEVEKPYSSFTKREKWFIVIMSAIGGLFR